MPRIYSYIPQTTHEFPLARPGKGSKNWGTPVFFDFLFHAKTNPHKALKLCPGDISR